MNICIYKKFHISLIRFLPGIVLLCIPCGLLYRPIEFQPIYEDDEEEEKYKNEKVNKDDSMIVNGEPLPFPEKIALSTVENSSNLSPPEESQKVRGARSHTAINVDSNDAATNLQRVKSLDHGMERRRTNTITESTGYLNVKDVFYPGSITALPEYQANEEKFRSVTSLHSQPDKEKHRHHTASHSKIPSLKEEDEDENLDSQATSASRGVAIWK